MKKEKLYEYKPRWAPTSTAIPAKNVKDFWQKIKIIYPHIKNQKECIVLYGVKK